MSTFNVCGALPSKSTVAPRTSKVNATSLTPVSTNADRNVSIASGGHASAAARSSSHAGVFASSIAHGGGESAEDGLFHVCGGPFTISAPLASFGLASFGSRARSLRIRAGLRPALPGSRPPRRADGATPRIAPARASAHPRARPGRFLHPRAPHRSPSVGSARRSRRPGLRHRDE